MSKKKTTITIKTHERKLKEAFRQGVELGKKMGKDYIRKSICEILDIPTNKELVLHEQNYHNTEE